MLQIDPLGKRGIITAGSLTEIVVNLVPGVNLNMHASIVMGMDIDPSTVKEKIDPGTAKKGDMRNTKRIETEVTEADTKIKMAKIRSNLRG